MNINNIPTSSPREVSAVDYIKFLARSTQKNISRWKVEDLFFENGRLITNKNKINKKFFQKLSAGRKKKKVISKLNIMGLVKRTNEKTILRLELEIKEREQRILKLRNNSNNSNIEEQVWEIINTGCWENPIIQGKYLFLNTTNNVILNSNNLGKFGAAFNLVDKKIYVTPYSGNKEGGDLYIHPHINSDGRICWGNISSEAEKAVSGLNLIKVFNFLHGLLNSYTGNAPYTLLSNFNRTFSGPGNYLAYPKK